jgi:hypothetical protein
VVEQGDANQVTIPIIREKPARWNFVGKLATLQPTVVNALLKTQIHSPEQPQAVF